MICRLCLVTLSNEDFAVHLYDNEGYVIEAHLLKIISTYFPRIQVTKNDPISTKLCEECSEILEDFHRFYLLIEEKQKPLLHSAHSQLQEVKNDADIEFLQLPTDEQAMKFYEEEPPFEIQNVVLADLTKYETPDVDTEQPPENPATPFKSESDLGQATVDANSDDDLPLIKLITKHKKKRSKRTKEKPTKPPPHRQHVEPTKKKSSPLSASQKGEIIQRNAQTIAEFMQLQCDVCKVMVQNFGELRAHFEKEHNQNAYVRCCNKMFQKPGVLVEHINWHRNPDIFQCDLCQKRLRSRYSLQVHKQFKHNSNKFVENIACPKCGKQFRGRKCLDNHLRRHPELDAKSFACSHCDKSFATAQRLRCHVASIHDNIFPHICDTCGKKFKFKPSFDSHILQHQGIVEPPQQCQICNAWLKNKNALRLHRFRHEQDNSQCTCSYCGRVCVTLTALRGHIRYAHRLQTTFQCTYCDKKFKVAKNLQEHMAIHTGTQLYSCPHCLRQCRSKSNMYVHIKRTHFNEWMQSKMARSNDPSHSNVQADRIRELETS